MALRSIAQRRALLLGQIKQAAACAAQLRGFASGEQQVGSVAVQNHLRDVVPAVQQHH